MSEVIWDEWYDVLEDDDPYDATSDDFFAPVLAEVLDDVYADAEAADLDTALNEMLDSLSPAEAVGVTKALQQIGRAGAGLATDPVVAQVAASALPVGGGILGSFAVPGVGTAVGTKLGSLAAQSLQGARQPVQATASGSRATQSSPAAARGLVLTQHPDLLKALLSAALGARGRKAIGGIPVAALLGMLSSTFEQAAIDADQLLHLDGPADSGDAIEMWDGDDGSLYTALIEADNVELAEAMSWQ